MRSILGFGCHSPNAYFCILMFFAASALAQTNLESELSDVVQQAVPSVVTVRSDVPVVKSEQNSLSFFSARPGEPGSEQKRYTLIGSGLYLNENGFIATRSSVVENARKVYVLLWNGEEVRADVIGIDDEKGIALLKIDSPKLPTLNYAKTNSLTPGSIALIIGNSLGVSPAISVGNISSADNDGFIQVSANIDPGANGAPVLNASGQVFGIVTGRIAYDQKDVNVISANSTVLVVPVDEIYKSAEAICKKYQESHGWIGLTVQRSQYSKVNPQIKKVAPGSPAEKAGLLIGDVILNCNGKEFENYYSLRSIVKDAKTDESLTLHVLRGQQTVDISLRVGKYDYASLFESVPFVDTPGYSEDRNGNSSLDWSINGNKSVESRLRQMELEIQNLRKQLLYQKKK